MSDSATQWTIARQAPLSMGLSRQEYWSELPCPSPGDLPQVSCVPCVGRWVLYHWGASLVAQTVKSSACNAGDLGSTPGSGRSPGEGNGNPLQYSCLENSMDGGTSWATVHGGRKESDTTTSLSLSRSHQIISVSN